MKKKLKLLLLALTCCGILTSCAEDLDDVVRKSGTREIQEFIWRGMNNIYLYKAEVPELANDRFATVEELHEFLDDYSSPESLFYDGLVAPEDRFSFLVDDYFELERAFDGISRANGMEYGLSRISRSSELVVGYVRYVLPNTSAAAQGLERGDLFTRIDGEVLTLENYARLLGQNTYRIGLAEWDGDSFEFTGEEVSLEKLEYTSNPVFLSEIFETDNAKVGYLMYNAFTDDFDPELKAVFGNFQAEGITDLILDLRYNGGGNVETASDLASMITGQFLGEIFSREEWNEEYQEYIKQVNPELLLNRFDNKIWNGESINSLQLSKVYILTTLRSASASELLINGLKPYINVVQIGEPTTGKFQASTTLYDSEDFGRDGVNPGHTYAIQPLIYKSLNANGVSDYTDGLPPDIVVEENLLHLGVLGDPSEPLLQAALHSIAGIAPPAANTAVQKAAAAVQFKLIGESGMDSPLYKKMYTEPAFPYGKNSRD